MAWTQQEQALVTVQEKYGPQAFTEDHLNYRRVGLRTGRSTVSAIGDTWDEALTSLEGKAGR